MNLLPLLNLLPQKIKVTFIHSVTGHKIDSQKIIPDELPIAFNRPTTIYLSGKKWRIVKAYPSEKKEYTQSGRLLLHLQEELSFSSRHFNMPSIAPEPKAYTEDPVYKDITLSLASDDWRQIEFLPLELLPLIKEEISRIEEILYPENMTENLLGFRHTHLRSLTDHSHLNIALDEFCRQVNASEKGNILLPRYGYVKEGYAVKSDNCCYYGILDNGKIQQLCLQEFDCMEEELLRIMIKYDLALVNWCLGQVISA